MKSATWRTTSSGPCGSSRAWSVRTRARMSGQDVTDRGTAGTDGARARPGRARSAGGGGARRTVADDVVEGELRLDSHGAGTGHAHAGPAVLALGDARGSLGHRVVRGGAHPDEDQARPAGPEREPVG